MRFPNYVWQTGSNINFTGDLSGNPSIAFGSDDAVYFTMSVRGSHPNAGTTLNDGYDIAVGKLSRAGILLWLQLLPGMNTITSETDPVLALGPENEMYIAYVTRGATPGNTNMINAPTFCPQICTNVGPEDIVIARVNTNTGSPVVQWVLQNGNFNSCNNESNPSITVDKVNKLLYVGFQSSANIQCNTSTGSPNVAIVCYNLEGTYYWTDSILLNSGGVNQNTAVAADTSSNVYLTYETTLQGLPRQIEVVKYTTRQINGAFSSYSLEWKASNTTNLVARYLSYDDDGNPTSEPPICMNPSIVCSPSGLVHIVFVTSGVMTGQTTTGSLFDLVSVCLDSNGVLKWSYQGMKYNDSTFRYINCFEPYITCDIYGNLYASIHTQTHDGYNIVLFKLSFSSGNLLWSYTTPTRLTYDAYPLARTNSVGSVLPTSLTPYKKTVLAVDKGLFVAAVNLQSPNYLRMFAFEERLYFENITPFGFVNEIKSGCKTCRTGTCGC
jgi:hypothetical protein